MVLGLNPHPKITLRKLRFLSFSAVKHGFAFSKDSL